MLLHVGRHSGIERAAVLEVVAHDEDPPVWYVAAAWGDRSDWYRNVQHNPNAEIRVGRNLHRVIAEVVDSDRAVGIYTRYVDRHPWAARFVGRMLGIDLEGSDPEVLARRIPLVALRIEDASTTLAHTARRTSSTRETQARYDRIAPFYGAIAGFWERPARTAGLDALRATRGESVLEIGCGPGDALGELARSVGPEGRAIGVDLSSGMCSHARRRLDQQGLSGSAAVVQADALSLPFDGGFDAAFMSFTLELFDTPDISMVLCECRRLLRPGGRLAVVALSRQHPAPVIQRAYQWGHERFPLVLDCRPIDLEASLRNAGFVMAQVKHLSLWGLPVAITVGMNCREVAE